MKHLTSYNESIFNFLKKKKIPKISDEYCTRVESIVEGINFHDIKFQLIDLVDEIGRPEVVFFQIKRVLTTITNHIITPGSLLSDSLVLKKPLEDGYLSKFGSELNQSRRKREAIISISDYIKDIDSEVQFQIILLYPVAELADLKEDIMDIVEQFHPHFREIHGFSKSQSTIISSCCFVMTFDF